MSPVEEGQVFQSNGLGCFITSLLSLCSSFNCLKLLYCVTWIINLDLPLLIFSIVNCMPIFRAWRCAILHLLHLLMSLHQTHMWWLSCLTTQSVSIYTMNFLIGDTYVQLAHPWSWFLIQELIYFLHFKLPNLQQYYNQQTRQKDLFYNLYVTVKYRCEGKKKSLELTLTNLLPQTWLRAFNWKTGC